MILYIGKMPSGEVIVDRYPQVVIGAKTIKSMPLEDYQSFGRKAVVIIENDKVILKQSESDKKQREINNIKSRLKAIDEESGSGRSNRKAVLDMAMALKKQTFETQKLAVLEQEAEGLREQLKLLNGEDDSNN